MKILLINKFLHPKGGSETYVFRIGAALERRGHAVQYFGMDHPQRQRGNRAGAYAPWVDYHGGSRLRALACIWSPEAAKQLRRVLEDFQPDVCHVNNFHHQLTPSIVWEIVRWRRQQGKRCPIVHTAHDSQLVCPNHLLRNGRGENCRKCLGGHYRHCLKNRCIHGSYLRSAVGALEAWLWDRTGIFRYLDRIIVPSRFLAEQLAADPILTEKLEVLHNGAEPFTEKTAESDGYVLYFGRYSEEKGIETLLQAVDALPEIPFVFAGEGPLRREVEKRPNIRSRGFLTGTALAEVIAGAAFTVVPSQCYENCPYAVLESHSHGVPVLGADIGGIPELIARGETGELFESGNAEELTIAIRRLWRDRRTLDRCRENIRKRERMTEADYCRRLERIYREAAQ